MSDCEARSAKQAVLQLQLVPGRVEVAREGAPILTITGDADELTSVDSVRAFHRALDQAGIRNELHVVPGRRHAFDFEPSEWQAVFDRIAGFLAEVVR